MLAPPLAANTRHKTAPETQTGSDAFGVTPVERNERLRAVVSHATMEESPWRTAIPLVRQMQMEDDVCSTAESRRYQTEDPNVAVETAAAAKRMTPEVVDARAFARLVLNPGNSCVSPGAHA